MGIRSYLAPDHLNGETLRQGDMFRVGLTWFSTEINSFSVKDEDQDLNPLVIIERLKEKDETVENFIHQIVGYKPRMDDSNFYLVDGDYDSLTKLAQAIIPLAAQKLKRIYWWYGF